MNDFKKIVQNDVIPFIESLIEKEEKMLELVGRKSNWFYRKDGLTDIMNESKTWLSFYELRLKQYQDYLKS